MKNRSLKKYHYQISLKKKKKRARPLVPSLR